MADVSIPFVKEVSITSKDSAKSLGVTTYIEIRSQSKWSEEVTTERITLFSDDKLIISLNGKSISHERKKS